jgi:hypothetical protein
MVYKYSSYAKHYWWVGLLLLVTPVALFFMLGRQQPASSSIVAHPSVEYPIHQVVATMFYVGEPADGSNGSIANTSSAWDEQWQQHFGGVDMPNQRNGWLPADFSPKQNPFYVALPYNDLDSQGRRKSSARQIYWYDASLTMGQSLLKDRWVKVCHNSICAYGQWEDVGPFGEDDVRYVFGIQSPQNTTGLKAGIDLSPALDAYLGVNGEAQVTWQFIDKLGVPDGPWLSHTNE